MEVHDSAHDWSESGIVSLTGWADRPPMMPPGNGASTARSLSSYLETSTVGSANTIVVDGAALLGERAALTGRSRNGQVSVGGQARLLPTRTGWAVISCARPDDIGLLGALVGRNLSPDSLWPVLEQWLIDHDHRQIEERIELLGIAGGVVPSQVDDTAAQVVPSNPPRSIEGALVVDFSSLWAGPLCAHLLGLGGARVVKVETPDRPDGARGGNSDFYDLLHGGHESVQLDPGTAEGRAALRHLVARADIVVEASRPRALARFGLDADSFVDAGCVWVSITARGRASDRIGFGDDIAASAGLVARNEDGSPVFVGDAIADPLTGLTAAAAVLASPAGTGRLCDISMSAVIASTIARGTSEPRSTDGAAIRDIVPSPPRARRPVARAAASGATTVDTLTSLGIDAW